MIRTSDYIEIMTRTLGQGEKIITIFISPPYIKLDFEYLKVIRKESGAEIVMTGDLGLGELMVVETSAGAIVLDERAGCHSARLLFAESF